MFFSGLRGVAEIACYRMRQLQAQWATGSIQLANDTAIDFNKSVASPVPNTAPHGEIEMCIHDGLDLP